MIEILQNWLNEVGVMLSGAYSQIRILIEVRICSFQPEKKHYCRVDQVDAQDLLQPPKTRTINQNSRQPNLVQI